MRRLRAQNRHSMYLLSRERTSIDCHKGIAHRLPNMSGQMVGASTDSSQ